MIFFKIHILYYKFISNKVTFKGPNRVATFGVKNSVLRTTQFNHVSCSFLVLDRLINTELNHFSVVFVWYCILPAHYNLFDQLLPKTNRTIL